MLFGSCHLTLVLFGSGHLILVLFGSSHLILVLFGSCHVTFALFLWVSDTCCWSGSRYLTLVLLGDGAHGSCAETCVFRHLAVVFFDRGHITPVSFGYLKLVVLGLSLIHI